MVLAIMIAVLLLLVVSGVLTYQNSRLIAGKEKGNEPVDPASLRYSVLSGHAAGFDSGSSRIVPLFQVRVPRGQTSAGADELSTALLCLYRDDSGDGEMTLLEAKTYMISRILAFSRQGDSLEIEIFEDRTVCVREEEMLQNLQQAATGDV